MTGQMTIFDYLKPPDDPVRNLVKRIRPYWTTSRQTILNAYQSGRDLEKVVKHEYNPYGGSGGYGMDFGKKGVFKLIGYDMRGSGIILTYDPYKVETMTWIEFGRMIEDLIRTGEFLEDEE